MKVVIEHFPASPPDPEHLSGIAETARIVGLHGYNLSGTSNANVRTVEVADQHKANVLTAALAHIKGLRIFHHKPTAPPDNPAEPEPIAPVVTTPIDFQKLPVTPLSDTLSVDPAAEPEPPAPEGPIV
jgi:hypothetical protein